MKKIKMMLLSLALIAVVGGALAFKAKFLEEYCTTTPVSGVCPDQQLALDCTTTPMLNSTAIDPEPGFFCYTTSDDVNKCEDQTCPGEAIFIDNF